ncbi:MULTISPECIES: YbaB/EbfC family nucleoid-associated protein [Actinoplanes]|uniref:YbaB/EbfC family nucleoid-associated protein n=1 Tax=Actinoplanes TaxID=1865 RepID=UPI0005F2C9BF|nr:MULTISPECIES: YbaB/EbfC family nucleoid-associated protein [Actinoplanes]
MQQIMKQAQKMQQQVAQAQAELAEEELTGTAGGGLVTVVITGLGEYKSVKIDPKVVDADDVETLEDLVLAAIHNAAEAQRELADRKMGPATGGFNLPGF